MEEHMQNDCCCLCSSTCLCAIDPSSVLFLVVSFHVLVICVPASMSDGRGCRLSAKEAVILQFSGSFWPDSMLDKDTFMVLLANILSLEFPYQISEWEEQLKASGALGDAGKVDVQ
eukprot:3771512-Amphidinium_carterae.1